jgi:hypothetical protein
MGCERAIGSGSGQHGVEGVAQLIDQIDEAGAESLNCDLGGLVDPLVGDPACGIGQTQSSCRGTRRPSRVKSWYSSSDSESSKKVRANAICRCEELV